MFVLLLFLMFIECYRSGYCCVQYIINFLVYYSQENIVCIPLYGGSFKNIQSVKMACSKSPKVWLFGKRKYIVVEAWGNNNFKMFSKLVERRLFCDVENLELFTGINNSNPCWWKEKNMWIVDSFWKKLILLIIGIRNLFVWFEICESFDPKLPTKKKIMNEQIAHA